MVFNAKTLSADAVAGAVTGVLMVPQGMAYALLAGLPPTSGLYACMVAPLVYALLGTSRPLSVGPVAVVSLMTGTALEPLFAAASPEYGQAALALALISGALLATLGVLRLGVLVNFLSYPVIAGFTMGAGTLIILSQAPQVMGIKVKESSDALTQLTNIVAAAGGARAVTLVIGLAAIAALITARGPLAGWLKAAGAPPLAAIAIARVMPLLVVTLGVLYSSSAHLREAGVAVVGPLAQGFPAPRLPSVDPDRLPQLVGPAILIALVGYLESISIAQLLARRRRERTVPNRELTALGMANAVVSVFQGMPVSGSLSRSAEADMAGAQTRMTAVFAAGLVMLVPLLFAGPLESLPRAVLAAIIISAVLRLLEWANLARTWRYDHADGLAWIATTLGVLVIGVERGLVAGIALSLLLYIWRTANPHLVEVGRVPHSDLFVEVDRHHELDVWPQLLLVRVDESLFFGNANAVQDFVMERVSLRPDVTDVILIGSAVNAIDASALAMIEDLADSLERGGVTVHLAEFKGPVLDRLAGTPLAEKFGRRRIHVSTVAAIISLASPPI